MKHVWDTNDPILCMFNASGDPVYQAFIEGRSANYPFIKQTFGPEDDYPFSLYQIQYTLFVPEEAKSHDIFFSYHKRLMTSLKSFDTEVSLSIDNATGSYNYFFALQFER